MPEFGKEPYDPLFTHALEPVAGLTVNDLNRYLPAVKQVTDLKSTDNELVEGLFLGDAVDGLRRIPDKSIDLIIADPPTSPTGPQSRDGNRMTLHDHYKWNEDWLKEAHRVLKTTGALYLLTGWWFSGMYHGLLSTDFKIQTRITWRNKNAENSSRLKTFRNELADIWFATKSSEFLFQNKTVTNRLTDVKSIESNLWMNVYDTRNAKDQLPGDKPDPLLERILNSSSLKMSWVLDPFMNAGSTGAAAKKAGRRFIGFEIDKDRLLLAMKRIDKS